MKRKLLVACLAITTLLIQAGPRITDAYELTTKAKVLWGSYETPITIEFTEKNGPTYLVASTDPYCEQLPCVDGWSKNAAQAFASADLLTGSLEIFALGQMISEWVPASSNTFAQFIDTVTFDLPDGFSELDIELSFIVDGVITRPPDMCSSTGCALYNNLHAGINMWSPETGPLPLLAIYTFPDPGLLLKSIPYVLSGIVTVQENITYYIASTLWANIHNGFKDTTTIFDFKNTGTLKLTLPEGVTFSSGSGVLLTESPEPPPAPENQPPTANAGDNLTISSEEQYLTVIKGLATDPDGDPLIYRWLEGGTELASWHDVVNGEAYLNLSDVPFFDLGQHTLTMEVSDGTDTISDDMILTVDNSAPHAVPSGGGVYEINTEVILGGSASDFDGDILQFKWMEGTNVLDSGVIACINGGEPVALPTYSTWNLGLGTHTITLQVDDGYNEPVSSEIAIEIVDTGVPTLAPVCNQLILWPPDHRMVDIHIEANASDDSGLPVTLDAEVTCDEPEDGLGDGDTAPDWTQPIIYQESGIINLQLRAERSGSGDGREYTVAITCTDLAGNSSTASVNVIVPHDKKK